MEDYDINILLYVTSTCSAVRITDHTSVDLVILSCSLGFVELSSLQCRTWLFNTMWTSAESFSNFELPTCT